MLLRELFDTDSVNIVGDMRTLMIDALLPLAARKVPHITVQQVIARLQELRSGTRVDRSLVMMVLDPNKVDCVEKIEGDLIYLSTPTPDEVSKKEEDVEAEKQKIRQKANKQAQKQVAAKSSNAREIAAKARDILS